MSQQNPVRNPGRVSLQIIVPSYLNLHQILLNIFRSKRSWILIIQLIFSTLFFSLLIVMVGIGELNNPHQPGTSPLFMSINSF